MGPRQVTGVLIKDKLVVQWLRLLAPNTGGPGSIPGQGTRSHSWQLRVYIPQLRLSAVKEINLKGGGGNWGTQTHREKAM